MEQPQNCLAFSNKTTLQDSFFEHGLTVYPPRHHWAKLLFKLSGVQDNNVIDRCGNKPAMVRPTA